MSEIKGLPLKFKLFLKGKFVGYEKHIDWGHSGIPGISIDIQYPGESVWYIADRKNCWIVHDEKRQFTGFYDRHGEEIYFGDRMRHPGGTLIFEVAFIEEENHRHVIGARAEKSGNIFDYQIQGMEVIHD